jgi:NhaP-type Na+/H+ or K+/H+ antiporter
VLPKYEITWNWRLCFVVGAVLSATDPVSVVATLKGLSSSSTSTKKLTYLIVGEALLNDGMALVLFDAVTTPDYSTPLEIVIYFIKVIFISPLLGFALGLGAIFILRVANRRVSHEDKTIQIAVTIGCAYSSFFIGQYVLNVSGVISTCSAGVMLAWMAPPLILQPHSLESIWEFLEWVGNTLIFMIAGLIVGRYVCSFISVSYRKKKLDIFFVLLPFRLVHTLCLDRALTAPLLSSI